MLSFHLLIIYDFSFIPCQVTDEEIDSGDLLEETIKPRKNLPPLLLKLNERRAEKLDYLGVSYGLTNSLLKYVK